MLNLEPCVQYMHNLMLKEIVFFVFLVMKVFLALFLFLSVLA